MLKGGRNILIAGFAGAGTVGKEGAELNVGRAPKGLTPPKALIPTPVMGGRAPIPKGAGPSY